VKSIDDKYKSYESVKNTRLSRAIDNATKRHNKRVDNMLKQYTLWCAVLYHRKDEGERVYRTQLDTTFASYKNISDFTRGVIERLAEKWMEQNWSSPVDFIGFDDHNFDPPFKITKLTKVDILDVPIYSFKDDITNGINLYNKFLPSFDGLVKDCDDDLKKTI